MKKIIILATVAGLLICSLICLVSCKAQKYKVICPEGLFVNVKSDYREGERVEIYFPYVATDTNYSFYLDGERINDYEYSDQKGFVFTFTMPAKDVTLDFDSKNSMVNPVQIFDEITMLVTYTESIGTASGEYTSKVILESTEDEYEHRMTVYHEDGNKDIYIVPAEIYESLRNYTETVSLQSWNDLEEYECLDGKVESFTILVNEEYITISTDQMPEDGELIFNYLYSYFTDYMTEAYEEK